MISCLDLLYTFGKIVEQRAFRDRLRFLIQVGVLGPASPEYERAFEILKNSVR
jgi:hypothetical protein